MDEVMQKATNFLPRVDRQPANVPAHYDASLVAVTAPSSIAAEQYRMLYHRLERARLQRPVKLVVLTSAVSGEGKSITAANLALVAAAADASRKVLLVDADLRRPRLGFLLEVDDRPGLAEFLAGDAALPEIVRTVQGSRLLVMPAGAPREDAGPLIAGTTMRMFLEQVRSHFDEIYVDVPPVLPVADGALLAAQSDGAVLVVKAGSTSRTLVWEAVEALAGVRVLGCVLNGVEVSEVPYLSNRIR